MENNVWYNYNMKEAEFQTFITKWMLYRYTTETGYETSFYDCKVVDGLSLAPSKVKEHQVRALTNVASNTGLSYKIADVGIGQKPMDGFMGRNQPSWLVILYKRSKNKERFFGLFDMKKWDGTSIRPEHCSFLFSFSSKNEIPHRIFF